MRHDTADLSVVIPAYNAERTIQETLASVLEQTVFPKEIIIVDDGSYEPLSQHLGVIDDRIRLVRIANGGPGRARHVGATLARSDWIAFLDADDTWSPEFVASQFGALSRFPGARLVVCDSQGTFEGSLRYASKFREAPRGYWPENREAEEAFVITGPLFPLLIRYQPMLVGTYVLHRSLYDEVGGFESPMSRQPSEDFEFALRCATDKIIAINPRVLFTYRMRAGSFSSSSGDFVAGDVRILEYALQNHPAAAAYREAIRDEIVARSLSVCQGAWEARNAKQFESFYCRIPRQKRSVKLNAKWVLLRSLNMIRT